MIFENRQHPLQHLGRFLVFAEQPVRQCQIVEGDRNHIATVPTALHLDVQGSLEDVLGLLVVLELTVENVFATSKRSSPSCVSSMFKARSRTFLAFSLSRALGTLRQGSPTSSPQ